jgi:hypothetical protein
MSRIVGFLVLLVCLTAPARAQNFIALQGEVAEPTNKFRESAGTGYGVRGTYMHFLSSYIALSGSAGYTRWGSRSNLPPNNDYRVIAVPVSLGAHLLLSRSIVAPYLGLAVGMDYFRVRGTAPNATAYADESEVHFAFSPHVGVGIHIAGPLGALLTGSYTVIYTHSTPSKYFSLSLGFAAGF